MSPVTNEPEAELKAKATVFVDHLYAEAKDLAKHFLTLIAGTLVLSVSLANQILPLDHANFFQKALLAGCWLLLLLAFGLAGYGVYESYRALEQATGGVIYNWQEDFRHIARGAYLFLDLAGVLFGLALFALAVVGASRLLVPR
jgi:hypothetical protein